MPGWAQMCGKREGDRGLSCQPPATTLPLEKLSKCRRSKDNCGMGSLALQHQRHGSDANPTHWGTSNSILSLPRALASCAQGQSWYTAVWISHGRKTLSWPLLTLLGRAFKGRAYTLGLAPHVMDLCSTIVLSPPQPAPILGPRWDPHPQHQPCPALPVTQRGAVLPWCPDSLAVTHNPTAPSCCPWHLLSWKVKLLRTITILWVNILLNDGWRISGWAAKRIQASCRKQALLHPISL